MRMSTNQFDVISLFSSKRFTNHYLNNNPTTQDSKCQMLTPKVFKMSDEKKNQQKR